MSVKTETLYASGNRIFVAITRQKISENDSFYVFFQ